MLPSSAAFSLSGYQQAVVWPQPALLPAWHEKERQHLDSVDCMSTGVQTGCCAAGVVPSGCPVCLQRSLQLPSRTCARPRRTSRRPCRSLLLPTGRQTSSHRSCTRCPRQGCWQTPRPLTAVSFACSKTTARRQYCALFFATCCPWPQAACHAHNMLPWAGSQSTCAALPADANHSRDNHVKNCIRSCPSWV